MNVSCAKENIRQINILCDQTREFVVRHDELREETGFLCDAVAYLCDYRKVLEKAIEQAKLNI